MLGPEHPSTLTSLGNLAKVLRDRGEYEAGEMYQQAVEGMEKVLGPEHPNTLLIFDGLVFVLRD